tara:strand:+ start:346 stop:537 length:192 start_codon:yes stop_codon:yes gene_type:complete
MREAWLSYHSIVNDVMAIQTINIKIDPIAYPNLQIRLGPLTLTDITKNEGNKPRKNAGTMTDI